MNTLELFKNYLSESSSASKITIKNYASDVNKFIRWFETKNERSFVPEDFNEVTIGEFINSRGSLTTSQDSQVGPTNQPNLQAQVSARSFERYLSSLRKFAIFLFEAKFIPSNPFSELSGTGGIGPLSSDPWHLKPFKNFLYLAGASKITSKNYMVDLNAFTSWLEYKGITNGISNYIEVINPLVIAEYANMLSSELGLSESTINRKMSSIRKFISFAKQNTLMNPALSFSPESSKSIIPEVLPTPVISDTSPSDVSLPWIAVEEIKTPEPEPEPELALSDIETNVPLPSYSSFAPLRLVQKLAGSYFLIEDLAAQKIIGFLPKGTKFKLSRPNITPPGWYKKYHNIAFVHYLHVGILIIYASFVGILVYNGFVGDAEKNKVLAVASPPKVLSFQGRLTDASNNPITGATNVRFQIYSNSEATGSAYLLWQELDNVSPDSNGVFSILLGNTTTTCTNGPTIPQTSACPIPSTLFTNNTNLYLGITVENTPELTPRQQIANVPYAANAQTLEGMLPITDSNATQANVVLALDSSGRLTIGGSATPIFQASGGKFTLMGKSLHLKTTEGSNEHIIIEPDGIGQIDLKSPLTNTGSHGNIAPGGVEINDRAAILATESAVAAFIVNNNSSGDLFTASASGNTMFTLESTGDISVAANTVIDTLSSGTITLGNVNATTISLGRSGQTISLPAYTGQNGVLFGTYGTGELAQATTSTSGLCLLSGASNPTWGSCPAAGGTTPFQQANGAIFANNSTVDFLIGGQATSSADFAITGVNGSGPATATLSGNLIVMPRDGAGGRVGIGTDTPSTTVHISSTDDTAVLTLQDADGTCTHNPEAGAETVSCSSDESLKTNIVDAGDVLSDLSKIQIRDYTVKASGNRMTGVIAQELAVNFPNMVKTGPNGLLTVDQPSTWTLVKAIQELYESINAFSKSLTTEALKAGTITANSITIATDSISVAGVSLETYIRGVVAQTISNSNFSTINSELISPLASFDQIHTGIISPLAGLKEIKVKGNVSISESASISGTLTASNATISGTLVASSASVSGDLATNELTVSEDATVSGTLYAGSIKADSIEGLDRRIVSAYHQQLAHLAASSSSSLATSDMATGGQLLDISNISADFGTFKQGLVALGPASFIHASFSDSISIGTTMQIGANSINTIGTDLALQPLRQGAIDFLAGAVRIETDGTLRVAGDAYFAKDVRIDGKLKTGRIEPGNEGLVIGRNESDEKLTDNPSLDVQGSASISGGLTINKLNLFKAQPAFALSETEVVATGSAGTASIKPYKPELTIYNPNITEDSLIYITPVGSSSNNTPSLLRQVANTSFTVGIPIITDVEIRFNWIIVN